MYLSLISVFWQLGLILIKLSDLSASEFGVASERGNFLWNPVEKIAREIGSDQLQSGRK